MGSKSKEISDMKVKICKRLDEINQNIQKKLDLSNNKSKVIDYKILEDGKD